MKPIKTLLLTGAAAFSLMTAASAQQITFPGDVITFGDSLSDNGNVFALTGSANGFPGSSRFVNPGGLTWIEQLLGGTPDPTGANAISPQNSPFQGTGVSGNVNLAIGGALAGGGNLGALQGFNLGTTEQFAAFAAAGGTIEADDTVTYWAGANNFFAGLPAVTSAADATALGVNVGQLAVGDITSLGTGAIIPGGGPGTLLFVNLPNLASLPATTFGAQQAGATAAAGVAAQGGSAAAQAQAAAAAAGQVLGAAELATTAFNNTLEAGVNALAAQDTNTNFVLLDVASVFEEIVANPAAFGFTNVTQGCLFVVSCATGTFEEQNTFLFSDGVHPTNAGYALIAELARQTLDPTIGGNAASGIADAPLASRQFVANQALDRARSFFLRGNPQGVGSTADVDVLDADNPIRGEGFAEAIGGTSQIGARGLTPQVNVDIYGFRIGAEIFQSENLVIGAQGSFVSARGSQPTTEFEPNTFGGDIYAATRIGNAFAAFSTGVARLTVDDIERSTIGPLTNTGNTDGFQFNAIGEVGYNLQLGGFSLLPTASLGYFRTQLDGYTETGLFAPLTFGDRRIDALTGSVNLRLAKNFGVADGLNGRFVIGVGYEDYLAYNANTLNVAAVAAPAFGAGINVGDPNGRGFVLDVGTRVNVNEAFSLAAKYEFGINGSNTRSHLGTVSMIARF